MTNTLKLLFLDVETAPNIGYAWEKWETTIIDFLTERYILCFTVKWQGEKKSHTYGLPDFATYSKDKFSDKELVMKLREFVDEADIIVAHNGDNFDIKIMNARFIANGILPPSPYKTVDTKKEAKKRFYFNSNSLADISKFLGIGKKLETGGFKLWKDCLAGDKKAWDKMKKYNKVDVELLEKVYLKLRPWMKNHPNMGINMSRAHCTNCGSDKTQRRGFSYSKLTKYQRCQCLACGSWFSGPAIK